MTATLIRIEGVMVDVYPTNGEYFTLEELQTVVGGYIEIISMKGDRYMIVNEEGLIGNLPRNDKASEILSDNLKLKTNVYGHVIIIDKDQMR